MNRRPSIVETLSDRAIAILALFLAGGGATVAEVLLP